MLIKDDFFKLLLIVFLVWAGLFYPTIESAVAIWYRSETFAHCFIILPICIYLIYQKWPKLQQAKLQPNGRILFAIIPTLLIWVFANLSGILVLEQAAAFLLLPLFIWCLLGNAIARILAFTMAFWMLSVPFGEFLVPHLQELTADITVWFLQLTGVPVYREGLYLAIPGGLFEVAVACSGIRYLIASFTLGTLYAYLTYRSLKKRLIFVAFALLLPLIANGIRAYGIVMIAYLSEMKYATGVDHLIYGWIFFGFIILVMFSLGNIWADPPEKMPQTAVDPRNRINIKSVAKTGGALLAVISIAFVYAAIMRNPVSDLRFDADKVFVAKQNIREQSWLPDFKNPTLEQMGTKNGVAHYLAYYDRNVQGQELINAGNSLYNFNNWSIVGSQDKGNYRLLHITNSRGAHRYIAYAYVTDQLVSPSQLKVKLLQAFQAFLGIPQSGFILLLSEQAESAQHLTELADATFTEDLTQLLIEADDD